MSEMKNEFEGSSYGPSSRHQIEENNKRRPKPVVTYDYTPTGHQRREVATQAANQKNAQIDRDNTFREKRMARRKGQAKKKFNERSKHSWGLE